jgi:hypothetical protein
MNELKNKPQNETELKIMIEEARQAHQEKCHAIKKFLDNSKYDYGTDSLMVVDYIHSFIGNLKGWIETFGKVGKEDEIFIMTNEKMQAAIMYSSMQSSIRDSAYFQGGIHKGDEINYKIFENRWKKEGKENVDS